MAKATTEERFWAKVNRDGPIPEFAPHLGPCWLWTASLFASGHPQFHFYGKNGRAHRYAYLTWVGPIPAGKELDHLCHVRHCVRPSHLEAVTRLENILRGDLPGILRARFAAQTHCKNGHEFTPENTYVCKEGRRHCTTCSLARQRRPADRAKATARRKEWRRKRRARGLRAS